MLSKIAFLFLATGCSCLLNSCSFSSSQPAEESRNVQEFDPYTNTWKTGRAIETPPILPPSPAPVKESEAEVKTEEGGALNSLKKPFRWIPGVN